MKPNTSLLLLSIVLIALIAGCDNFSDDNTNSMVTVTVLVQLNNFSGEEVQYWTAHNSTRASVDAHSQSARTDIITIIARGPNTSPGKIYIKKAGSSNEYDAQRSYDVGAGATANEETVERIFTWNGQTIQ